MVLYGLHWPIYLAKRADRPRGALLAWRGSSLQKAQTPALDALQSFGFVCLTTDARCCDQARSQRRPNYKRLYLEPMFGTMC